MFMFFTSVRPTNTTQGARTTLIGLDLPCTLSLNTAVNIGALTWVTARSIACIWQSRTCDARVELPPNAFMPQDKAHIESVARSMRLYSVAAPSRD